MEGELDGLKTMTSGYGCKENTSKNKRGHCENASKRRPETKTPRKAV